MPSQFADDNSHDENVEDLDQVVAAMEQLETGELPQKLERIRKQLRHHVGWVIALPFAGLSIVALRKIAMKVPQIREAVQEIVEQVPQASHIPELCIATIFALLGIKAWQITKLLGDGKPRL